MFEERIARGLTLFTNSELDSIDTDRLDMESPDWCVVGQVTHSYEQWVDFYTDKVTDIDEFLAKHGFILALSDVDYVSSTEWYDTYRTLTGQWRTVLTARLDK